MVECGGWIEESHGESNFVFLFGGFERCFGA